MKGTTIQLTYEDMRRLALSKGTIDVEYPTLACLVAIVDGKPVTFALCQDGAKGEMYIHMYHTEGVRS